MMNEISLKNGFQAYKDEPQKWNENSLGSDLGGRFV